MFKAFARVICFLGSLLALPACATITTAPAPTVTAVVAATVPDTPPVSLKNVSVTTLGNSLVFFDRDTGNLWLYGSADAPPSLLGRFESFDKPLTTETCKSLHDIPAATLSSFGAPLALVLPPPAPAPVKTADFSAVADQVNALPKNLWPAENENQVKRDARDQWLTENIKPATVTLTARIRNVTICDGKVTAMLDGEKAFIWGKSIPLDLTATFDQLKAADVLDWQTGQPITLTGVIQNATPESSIIGDYIFVSVSMDHAKPN